MTLVRMPRWIAQQALQLLARTMGSERALIERRIEVFSTMGEATTRTETIYDGEVMVMPGTGQVDDQGMGQVETMPLQILVPGTPKISQGDFVNYRGRQFQVEDVGNIHNGGTPLTLRQHGQREGLE